ncbi:aladin-like isoform X1 [Daphnia carinata]|uniref:aladin-like isoform X1 n=1 Tax=Daphnia carinata TaxID=120202 RepID=UPI00257C4CDA|nr:aladin-like isoform X1 [Daphnia carinata]
MSSQLIGMESFREYSSFAADDFVHTDLSKTHVENQLPKVNINVPVLPPTKFPRNEAALAFIPIKDGDKITIWKQFLFTWRTQGIYQALELLSQTDLKKYSASQMTYGLVTLWKTVKVVQHVFMPLSNMSSGIDTITMFSHTKDWSTSPARYLAWHPHCNKLAVATRDDTVLVYTGSASTPVVVRHSSQKNISSMSWRPLCSAQLAVGCASGVALWTVDPASLGTRPSASCLTTLPHPTSINSVAWDPQGKFLASGSAQDSSLYIWNVENREATLLQKIRGGGYTFLTWSPTGDRLLACTPGNVFKIWETRTWSAEIWDVMNGYVQSAAWSPCGTKAIFADSAQPTLYCVSKICSTKAATVVADFTETQSSEATGRLSRLVQDLAWDSRGERLAVTFRSSDYVALFRTRYSPTLSLFPCGILKGEPDEVASTIQFKPDFENGALLTVAWSSGRIQHVPFSFLPQHLET